MLSRRHFLMSASAFALAAPAALRARAEQQAVRVRPVPIEAVRLRPSPFLDAVEANRRFLLSLEPDRLLHNFHKSAGLSPKGPTYGGWEARGIAGHSLGHYLSACSLLHAQTGDEETRERVRYIVGELARCQAAHGDGYVGGTTVERDGEILDGKIVFEEIRRGDIRAAPFDVNGGWVPLYTWHKVHAGLIEAVRTARVEQALPVMLGMAGYLAAILEALDDEAMQRLLVAEYGGLNDSYAETYALTGDPRWLRVAERIRDRRVLDPLAAERDILSGLHANTQIPKLIGLARLYELTGAEDHATAARFFRDTVARHHSYVIGGNSEREHFGPPDVIASRLNDRTCEACNSYNMLKLTRHVYGWAPDAALFDYYERVHLNHILAHQHPETGMFAYFMPLSAGARRTWSTQDDSFWCCVGSGMESHAKHGDSIYWQDDATLYVNLFIPSALDWRGLRLELDTRFPSDETVTLSVAQAPNGPLDIALRLPGWCAAPAIRLNGVPAAFERRAGYAVLRRSWRRGDRIELTLPMELRVEPTPDDPSVVAYLHGPLVLAADLGEASAPFEAQAPALVDAAPADAPIRVGSAGQQFRLRTRPVDLPLVPFFRQHDRRTAVYFPVVSETRWGELEATFAVEQAARVELDARTVDRIRLGESASERAHGFRSNHSDLLSWGGRSGRQAWWGEGNYIAFDLAVRPGPMVLQALYWGEEVGKNFAILVDGREIAAERRGEAPVQRFVSKDYPLPSDLTEGKASVTVRIETRGSDAPVYECRTLLVPQRTA
jgi:hypothetical protein